MHHPANLGKSQVAFRCPAPLAHLAKGAHPSLSAIPRPISPFQDLHSARRIAFGCVCMRPDANPPLPKCLPEGLRTQTSPMQYADLTMPSLHRVSVLVRSVHLTSAQKRTPSSTAVAITPGRHQS